MKKLDAFLGQVIGKPRNNAIDDLLVTVNFRTSSGNVKAQSADAGNKLDPVAGANPLDGIISG